ncbi:MAG: TetR/AcrR family transcriptional regulator [Anaerocolumna sp.]
MNGFQRRKEMKMNSILQSAYDLFLVRGIKDVSIAEIAEKAKVSQVSIYNFFDSKENLARQAIFTYMNEKMSEVEELIYSKLTFREKLEKMFLDTKKNENSTDQEFYESAIWNDPMVQSFIEEYYQTRTIPLILHLVEQGKKESCVDSNISTEAVLLYLSAFKNMLSQTNITKKARSDIGTLFFYGLQGKPVDANSFGNVDK